MYVEDDGFKLVDFYNKKYHICLSINRNLKEMSEFGYAFTRKCPINQLKKMATDVSQKPSTAFEIEANIGSETSSRNLEAALLTKPDIKFYTGGKRLYSVKFAEGLSKNTFYSPT